MSDLHKLALPIGKISGCHQRADRSFFICGKQFPVCARCTGVFFGECMALATFRFFSLPLILLLFFCSIMLLDWLIQHIGIKESTNWRRLATGLLGGYGYFSIVLKALAVLKGFFETAR